jgi:hypothetical protein
MENGKQKLKLDENIAAVRFGEFAIGDQVTGVAEIIPAGETIQLDRKAPVVGHHATNRVERVQVRRVP